MPVTCAHACKAGHRVGYPAAAALGHAALLLSLFMLATRTPWALQEAS